jgi:hypothetical protein
LLDLLVKLWHVVLPVVNGPPALIMADPVSPGNREDTFGITIASRGRLADLEPIEDIEDRLLDLAVEVGGQAEIWRTTADRRPGPAFFLLDRPPSATVY